MAQKDLVELLRRIGEKRAPAAEWEKRRAQSPRLDLAKADLSNLELPDINLAQADLSSAVLFNTNLSGADLSGAALTYADLRRANLANALLVRANLSAAVMQGANLVDTNMKEALLQGARLGGAYLVGAVLIGADLANADLRGANCKFANFTGAKMGNVNVEDADLTQAELSEAQRAGLLNLDRSVVHGKKPTAAAPPAGRKPTVTDTYDDLFPEQDAYAILGIKPGASHEELVHAYRKRAKEYHPDRVAHLGVKLQEVARREFERIQHAYKSLTQRMAKPCLDVAAESGNPAAGAAASPRSARALSLEECQALAKRYPYNDRILYNLGVKYFEAGWVQLAIESFEKALALNPNNTYAAHNLRVAKLMQELIT
ncbi:MAG: pentapeptide repeat-containing protein [Candidatus Sumerlaeia bacterium]|nr:pentapeptide repeat-containing protein [Candidatus Sumerlaeia bacterium]